jgi:hypothetical protein
VTRPTALSRVFDGVMLLTLASSVALVVFEWERIPESVPTHFDLEGRADAWSPKWMIVLLPGVPLAIFLVFKLLSRFPRLVNYPWPVTDEQRARLHPLTCEMLSCLSMTIGVAFFALLRRSIETAKRPDAEPSPVWALAFVASVALVLGVYLLRLSRARNAGPDAARSG